MTILCANSGGLIGVVFCQSYLFVATVAPAHLAVAVPGHCQKKVVAVVPCLTLTRALSVSAPELILEVVEAEPSPVLTKRRQQKLKARRVIRIQLYLQHQREGMGNEQAPKPVSNAGACTSI